ncbi:T9SS type B sorting domain-containing protein [Polaribacter sp. MSW13]|uniref:T9SS type B sorting domain-containing protein n=1 Tax=Polaribacter marinus TaxID=2916838 RepID=A0A9X1VKM1_9FLAO|nr:T9SS type B sorting domain-containing protein [Polaribacter marinus]MCI2227882.1 T9SS type B sorting domain-containing protein [Polaribacter marinus]
MKKSTLLLLLLIINYNLFSQNETNNWYFGNKAGLDFDQGDVRVLEDGVMDTPAGCTTISDKNGNLLFYTNGETIWNKNHTVVDDGSGLTGQTTNMQSSLIIPKPGSDSIFYIFRTRSENSTPDNLGNFFAPGIYLTEIEVSNNFPLGKIIRKNAYLIHSASSEKLSAVHHKDGKSIWLATLTNPDESDEEAMNNLAIYKIDETGLVWIPIRTVLDNPIPALGTMKFSPNGKKLAIAGKSSNNYTRYIYLYDFDNATGQLTENYKISPDPFGAKFLPNGIEFSQNSKMLYYMYTNSSKSISGVIQYDLTPNLSTDPKTYLYYEEGLIDGSLQLANNGKIYVTLSYYGDEEGETISGDYLDVIEEPNKAGFQSNYRHHAINLNSGASNLGLPTFIQSYFASRIITENKCIGELISFEAESFTDIQSISWNFGDGNTSIQLNPSHLYGASGTYTVKAELTLHTGEIITVYKKVTVYPLPDVIPNERLVQCDTDNNGVDYFDLFDIGPKVVIDVIDKSFVFYRNRTDAENDQNSIANPEAFENESNPQELFVRVISKEGCASITNFFIESKFVSLGNIDEMFTCDSSDQTNGDSKGAFDLRTKRAQIKQNFGLDNTNRIRFYPTLIDAQTTNNLLPDNFISPSTTIYVRVDNELGCGGMEPIKLTVNKAPIINLSDSYTICDIPSQHPPIILDGNSFNHRYEWKDETGNIISTNREYTLNTIGSFSLTAYRTENGIECSSDKEFTVINPDSAVFQEIIVDTETENNTIFVRLLGNSNYQFSLDNITFLGNGLEHTFNYVNPGVRTVYVRDINNCEPPVQTNVSVIGYQKFFTPNGDGNNDYWNIKGIDSTFFKSVEIIIFDRFGNIVHTITEFGTQGWDGTYNGKLLSSNGYWFKAEITDLEDNVIKESGNFSLVRK